VLAQYGAEGDTLRYREFLEWCWLQEEKCEPVVRRNRVEYIFNSAGQVQSGKMPRAKLEQVLRDLGGPAVAKTIDEGVARGMWLEAKGPEDEVDIAIWLDWVFSGAVPESLSYLAKCRVADLVTCPRTLDPEELTEGAYATLDDFREQHAGDEKVLAQLKNRVLVCPNCAKPNAYTLSECNACGAALAGVEESTNDNIFMGFVYGVAKGRFPLLVSTRAETEDMLAFDDPLAVTVVHLCVIPTSVFCPDIRFLFSDPARGLKLIDDMMECARKVLVEQYWADDAFRQKYFCGEEAPQTLEKVQELAVLGFNFPPSMFQLHLQVQHGPLFPFHDVKLRQGSHYNFGRFYPFEYMRRALELGDAVRMDIDDNTKIEDVVAKVTENGIHYDKMHAAMIEKAKRLAKRFPVWKKEDFEYTVTPDGKVVSNDTGEAVPDIDVAALQTEDSKAMKNYAKPKCSLYRYPKKVGEVKHFCDVA